MFVGLINITKLMAVKKLVEMHWIVTKKAVHFHFSNLVVIVDPFRETRKWSLNENWKQFCLGLISVCFDKIIFMDKLDPFLTHSPSLCWSPT